MSAALHQVLRVRTKLGKLRPGLYRVILVAPREGVLSLYRLANAEDAVARARLWKPYMFPLAPLNDAIEQGSVSVVPELSREQPNNVTRNKMAMHERCKRNEKILKPLVEPETLFRMLVSNTWHTEIELAAKAHSVSTFLVGRLMCRYFFVSMDVSEACRLDFWVKGAKRAVKQKLGRIRERVKSGHRADAIGRNTDDQDKENIEVFYNSLEDQSISVAQMYRDYEKAYRPERLVAEATGSVTVQVDESRDFITERQFRYALKEIKGELELLLKAAGERKTNLQHRVALGSARDRIPYPGHTYIVDATVADVYLVSAFDRRRIIGRPVLYVVIDAFSSLIVSVHVALAGPNLNEARIAMFRAVADKTRWLNWLGLEKLSKWLPQGCRPTFWLADKGELHSKGSYEIQFKLETSLSIAAAYRADWKSIVERNFGVLNETIHWMPGAVRERLRERGTPDPRLDAVLTLKEFTRLIVRQIAVLNFTRDMSRHLTASLVTHGIDANPVGFWAWGLEYIHGSAAFFTYEEALRAVFPQLQGDVTRLGIVVGGDRYVSDWMREHETVRLAGYGVPSAAAMFASPDEPGLAWCALPTETSMREVRLHSDRQVSGDYSLEDILEATTVRKFAGQDLADDTADDRVALERENDRDIAIAKELAAAAHADSPLSKSARTADIKANRKQEIEDLARGVSPTPTPGASRAIPTPLATASAVESAPPEKAQPVTTEASDDDYFARMSERLGNWSTS